MRRKGSEMTFQGKINETRTGQGVTMRGLALRMGVTAGYICKIEHGYIPSPKFVVGLSESLGVDRDYLIGLAIRAKIEEVSAKYRKMYTSTKQSQKGK